MRTVELEHISNVRDLGGIRIAGGRVVKPGLIYRGSALANPSPRDTDILFDRLGIRCVIDLRTGWEREANPDKVPTAVLYRHIPFFDLERVGYEYMKALPGTRRIGHDFACDPLDFYRTMPNRLTVLQMREAVNCVFDSALAGKPVYFHCTGGKDRAGVTAALVLRVLGADDQTILDDYLETNVSRDAHIQKTYERFLRLCNNDAEMAQRVTYAHRARRENIEAFRQEVCRLYGSEDEFITNQLNIDDARRHTIVEGCTNPA